MTYLAAVIAMLLMTHSHADDKGKWTGMNKPLTDATYLVYSGESGDRRPPTNTDRKLAIAIRGQAAKEIFDAIGPDAKGVTCSLEDGERMRSKGEVWCSYTPSDGYMCFLGFNLRTGKPHSGGTC
ncbi:hypothetical protein LK540_14535 [Massilia sp. IC2-278]|uniref:hypothetical protein n=1 Tax=Massilia sp. IC2-278 TaxID=2887200 RepID=UPI001E4CB9E1|nr:hypothetical protein [Massilia sp. IC2-278]MCC2961644.1 hypothetical protein [Massilia sp. IC2-278]